MPESIKAGDYVRLGELAASGAISKSQRRDEFDGYARELLALCGSCGFPAGQAAAQRIVEKMNRNSGLDSNEVVSVNGWFGATLASLKGEADQRETAALQTDTVSRRLRSLPTLLPGGTNLTAPQNELWEEAIRCIECGAYRAGAVMGWNLAYDYMRTWMDRMSKLGNLTAGLAQVVGAKPPKTPPVITKYEEFFAKKSPDERTIIEAMGNPASGPIIPGEVHDHLVQYLRYRNKYAHASGTPATPAKTNSYIENLIEIIVAPPFV